MAFHVLKIGGYDQYRYAWFEVSGEPNYGNAPHCPACHRPVGMLAWLPPHVVELKQAKHVGDFVLGAGGCPFLCQARVVERWRAHGLSGMDCLYPIQIAQNRTRQQTNDSVLYGIGVQHSVTRVEHDRMGVAWTWPPDANYCRTCGPGGGGVGGTIRSWERIVVDERSWRGEDLFFAVNFPGTMLVSERAANVIRSEEWSNVTTIPADEYGYAFHG